MTTILLIVIYIAFIGLGIPDSLFGTAWPVIYREFGVPLSSANYVTITVIFGTVLSSALSARIINKIGTAKITVISTVMTAFALLGSAFSDNILFMCLFGIPLGIGAGAIDAALNNYVALHYNATHMNFLHCFYGVGVSLSPYLISLAISGDGGWRGGYMAAFYLQIIISIITIVSLPVWKKVNKSGIENRDGVIKILSFKELLKVPALPLVWCIFTGSCAIECVCGSWGSTFLVDYKNLPADTAAKIIMLYYLGMTLGRFFSGILATKLSSWQIIYIGFSVVFVAIVMLFLPLTWLGASLALFMIGLGNGPVFPNLIHLTPKNFGEDISQSVMGSQMATAYVGIMILPVLFGVIAQKIGVYIFPHYLAVIFVVTIAAICMTIKVLKRNNKYEG